MNKLKKSIEINNSPTFRLTTLFGQAIGALSLFFGFAFSLLGLSGTLDLVIESNTINARLVNASPGVVFIIVGLFILWRYKPKGSTTEVEEREIHRFEQPLTASDEKEAKDFILKVALAAESILQAESYSEAEEIKKNLSEQERKFVEFLVESPNILNKSLIDLGIKKIEIPISTPSSVEIYRKTTTSDSAQVTRSR